MNIRQWFGIEEEGISSVEVDRSFDGLLELFAKALQGYFNVAPSTDVETLLATVRPSSKGDELFIKWLKEIGLPTIYNLSKNPMPNDEQLIAKIDYEKFILENELTFEYPQDVRSGIINIIDVLPDYIADALQEQAASTEVSYDNQLEVDKYFCLFDEMIFDLFDEELKVFQPNDQYNVKTRHSIKITNTTIEGEPKDKVLLVC